MCAVEICELPAETGPCRAAKQRYYHDAASSTCRSFTYGGCNGNANRFLTLDNCRRACEQRNVTEDERRQDDGTTTTTPVDGPTRPPATRRTATSSLPPTTTESRLTTTGRVRPTPLKLFVVDLL